MAWWRGGSEGRVVLEKEAIAFLSPPAEAGAFGQGHNSSNQKVSAEGLCIFCPTFTNVAP